MENEPKSVAAARYLLHLAKSEPETEAITHLRLQKLLYYVQGWSLASTDQPFFDEPIQAWPHGPVAVAAYQYFCKYSGQPIANSEASDPGSLTQQERDLIEGVWSHYKQYSATKLRTMTHSESPYLEATQERSDPQCKQEINRDAMRRHFTELYERELAEHGWTGASLEDFRRARTDRLAGRVVALTAAYPNLCRTT